MPYRRVRGNGVTFVLRTEPGHPELLHIYARHLTSPQNAIDTFFDPGAASAWNAERALGDAFRHAHALLVLDRRGADRHGHQLLPELRGGLSMRKHVELEQLPDVELSPEEDAKVARMTEEAAGRVNFFWGKEQVDTVKRAADQMGVPYQAYIKQVVYRQAIADLRAAREALPSAADMAAAGRKTGG